MKRLLSLLVAVTMAVGVIAGVQYVRDHRNALAAAKHPKAAPDSPIALENAKPGSRAWNTGLRKAGIVEGFASRTSVAPGESLDVSVRSRKGKDVTPAIYRMGWYGGAGARLIAELPPVHGDRQSACEAEGKTKTVTCRWRRSFSLIVDPDWVSGIYLVRLTTSDHYSALVPFVVREATPRAPIVFASAVTTWQAYNDYGGRSLYKGPCVTSRAPPRPKASPSASASALQEPSPDATPSQEPNQGGLLPSLRPSPSAQPEPDPSAEPSPSVGPAPQSDDDEEETACGFSTRSRAVSFDRPYEWPGDGQLLRFEYPMLFWLESRGYDVAYATSIDVHAGLAGIDARKVFLSVGHDEYYSLAMRTALEKASANGTSLAFLGANTMYRQIRLEDAAGVPNRIEVSYKRAGEDPLRYVEPKQTTVNWRDGPVYRPEQALLGSQYDCNPARADWVVTGEPPWLFSRTGFSPGDAVPHLVGYEYDKVFLRQAHPDNLTYVARSPLRCGGRPSQAHSTFYVAPSGAGVFNAGTMWFTCVLAAERCTQARRDSALVTDERVQKLVDNLLKGMLSKRFSLP